MTLYTHAGSLTTHRYVWIEPSAIGVHDWIRAVWFGLSSYPGRAWGCHVLLECGAVYRNVPLHKLASRPSARKDWKPNDAQTWDSYGWQFSVIEYSYLSSLNGKVRLRSGAEESGMYMFTVIPVNDAFSAEPEQAKEFYFLELENGRFTAQPTNHVLLNDKSFCEKIEWPNWVCRQNIWFSSEE